MKRQTINALITSAFIFAFFIFLFWIAGNEFKRGLELFFFVVFGAVASIGAFVISKATQK